MNTDQVKARIFDAEQALTFAREAIEENDSEALQAALRSANTEIESALVNALKRVD